MGAMMDYDDPDIAHDERVSQNLEDLADEARRALRNHLRVIHVHGFARDGEVRGVDVTVQDAESVIEVARRTIGQTIEGDHTELVSFQRSWPIDQYGVESAVVKVEAVTRTTLDGGETWLEMWHWFGTASTPWGMK